MSGSRRLVAIAIVLVLAVALGAWIALELGVGHATPAVFSGP